MIYQTRDGAFTVEPIERTGSGYPERDGSWLRVNYHGWFIGEVRTPAELTQWFPLAELEAA